MAGRRVLITGVGSYFGTELARRLEADDDVEHVVGLDTRHPRARLKRTELIDADIRDPEIAGLIAPTARGHGGARADRASARGPRCRPARCTT